MPRQPTSTPTEVQCDYCSRWYMRTSNGQRLCPDCASEHNAERKREQYREKRRAQLLDGSRRRLVFVVGYGAENTWPSESEEALDFKGSMFFAGDFDVSLRAGCFPSGLIVRRYGHLRAVKDNRLVDAQPRR